MRLVGSSITTPSFIIISVSLLILSILLPSINNGLLVGISKEAMPMSKKTEEKITETFWALGVSMVGGVILA